MTTQGGVRDRGNEAYAAPAACARPDALANRANCIIYISRKLNGVNRSAKLSVASSLCDSLMETMDKAQASGKLQNAGEDPFDNPDRCKLVYCSGLVGHVKRRCEKRCDDKYQGKKLPTPLEV